ncbi:MAG TPA: signal peptidase II [Candidatus Obscuribacterales bacterium]
MPGKLVVPLVALSIIALDQVSKAWARAHLASGATRPLVPGIVHLNYTTNTGGAFGIGRDYSWLMTALAILLTAAVAFWIVRREHGQPAASALERLGLGLLLGGALGNLCDRFTVGRVTDFLEFSFMSFPVFNVADMAIDAGILLIAIDYYIQRRKTGAESKDASEGNL